MNKKELVWRTEKRKINDLVPYEGNPRQMTQKQKEDLEESLKRFNLMSIPVVNTDNIIVSGHQRLKILQLLGRGEEEIDVRIPNRELGPEELREANLRENKNLGSWDYDMLANYDEKVLVDVGFSREELDDVFGLNIDEDFDVNAELEKFLKGGAKRVKSGDIWKLGEHRLVIGDCVDRNEWNKLFEKERFDFMFTDPPYKLAYTKRARKIRTKEGVKLKKDKVYESVGKTDGRGRFKGWVKTKDGFGYRSQRSYLGVEKKGGVPEYDEWLSIANDFQNTKGSNIMVFENWRNTIEMWQAIAKYWKIKNMII